MEKQIQVRYARKGLANFFGDHIEINENLKKSKRLRDYVIKHELGHRESFDLWHEFQIDWKVMPSLFLFVFSHPSTWIDFSPIQLRKEGIVFDLNLTILYLFSISLIVLIIAVFF